MPLPRFDCLREPRIVIGRLALIRQSSRHYCQSGGRNGFPRLAVLEDIPVSGLKKVMRLGNSLTVTSWLPRRGELFQCPQVNIAAT